VSASGKNSQPVRVGIEGVSYSLTHVPDLVRYGSKPIRELRANPALTAQLTAHLRDFPAATAYAPNQVYIGNIAPGTLSDLPKPWYEKLIEGATAQGRFGDLVDQAKFYALLAGADQFDLVTFEEKWFQVHAAQHAVGRAPRLRSITEIQALCDKGALALRSDGQLVGAFEPGHAEDTSLAAEVLLENLAGKDFRGALAA
jgi:betaine reductase